MHDEILGASTWVPGPRAIEIFGYVFVVVSAVVVIGYVGFEVHLRREARRREQRHFFPAEDDAKDRRS